MERINDFKDLLTYLIHWKFVLGLFVFFVKVINNFFYGSGWSEYLVAAMFEAIGFVSESFNILDIINVSLTF